MKQFLVLFYLGLWLPTVLGADFDQNHTVWNDLLQKHVRVVRDGVASQVDYAGMQRDQARLRSYTEALSAVAESAFKHWPRNERLAFLINTYNAQTVTLILSAFPGLKSIKDLGGLFKSPWKKEFFQLFGRPSYLDYIEHELLRGPNGFGEPRIHVALVCASIGCPALRNEAYVGARLEQQLETAMSKFLSDRDRNRFNRDSGKLEVSKIFDWYGADFAAADKTGAGVVGYLGRYANALAEDEADRNRIRQGQVAMKFLDYDWGLNNVRGE